MVFGRRPSPRRGVSPRRAAGRVSPRRAAGRVSPRRAGAVSPRRAVAGGTGSLPELTIPVLRVDPIPFTPLPVAYKASAAIPNYL